MTITVTKEQLAAMDPCDMDRRLALFGRKKKMSAHQALEAGAAIRDLLWVAQRLGRRDLCIQFALAVAQRVAHLDKTGKAQACLDATRAYVADDSAENLADMRKKRSAASDASASAAASYAAASAAASASDAAASYAAASDASYAAASDASDASAAASASDAVRAQARKTEEDAQREIFLEIFG